MSSTICIGTKICCTAILSFYVVSAIPQEAHAQNRHLVWSDEFNGSSLDQSIWSFRLGPFNDTAQYSTDRPANTKVVDGKLQLIALRESYDGFDYTASVITTQRAVYWQYGRIEASIKLPSSNGFVPAFWLQPEDERYGWWPASGEIDVMEHPTNQRDQIYGTVHTAEYNSLTGSGHRGDAITIPDAESAFHLYAVEWTPDKIDFFVDDTKYFTFNNEKNGSRTWPFDQPFYIILNMAVGGGWVGDPTSSTIFPAIMEVDYVRVYQDLEDMAISGPDYVIYAEKDLSYSAPDIDGSSYEWSVPNTARITSGQGTPNITVDWGMFTGTVELLLATNEGRRLLKHPVEMSGNLIQNGRLKKGSKYWDFFIAYDVATANFAISTEGAHSGDHSISVDVTRPGVNAWDVQVRQSPLAFKAGQAYNVSFWAISETNSAVKPAVIDASSFFLYASRTFQLTNTWEQYSFDFVLPTDIVGSFNVDMGGHNGQYQFSDVQLTMPEPETNNQVDNADFTAGDSEWIFNTFPPAVAQGSVVDGEYAVEITDGGANAWDVHVGQTGFTVEKDREYTVSFDAYSTAPREVFPLVGKNSDPWTVYSDNGAISLSTNRKTYTFSFTMKGETDTQARFGFDIGASSDDVFLDNAFLSKGTVSTRVREETPLSGSFLELGQNWPNPFGSVTTIDFELPRPGFASLKIFDIHGRLIETVLDGHLAAGKHEARWTVSGVAPGVYICNLSTQGGSRVQTMILIK
jgi:beta-glucanase (GH16 family)